MTPLADGSLRAPLPGPGAPPDGLRDTVVVGAGVVGASVAYHLSVAGTKLLLVEQGVAGGEASAQNAGMQRRLTKDPVERALACRGGEWLENPPDEWKDEVPLVRKVGGLVCGPRYDEAVADLREHGLRVERVDASVEPVLRGSGVDWLWWCPDDGLFDAHTLVTGFLRGSRSRGATVRLGAEVTRIRVSGGRVVGVEIGDEVVPCTRVVLATAAWAPRFARALGLHRPLAPLSRTLLLTVPHPLSRPDHPWIWLEEGPFYVRPEGAGFLCSPCDETPTEPQAGPGSSGPVDPYWRAVALERMERWFPPLAGIRFARGWTGLRTFTPDRRPLMGADPEVEGLWWATGLGGYGVTTAFAVGEAIAAWIGGRSTDWLDPGPMDPGRFRSSGVTGSAAAPP